MVLYGCETWSLTLREEHRLRVSANSGKENIWIYEKGGNGSRRKLLNGG